MLSILIPTYNYNISALVEEVYKQIKQLDVAFEKAGEKKVLDGFVERT